MGWSLRYNNLSCTIFPCITSFFLEVCVRSNCRLRRVWSHGAWVTSGANSHDAGLEIPCSLRRPQVAVTDPKGTPLDSKLSEINPGKPLTIFCTSMCNLISLTYRTDRIVRFGGFRHEGYSGRWKYRSKLLVVKTRRKNCHAFRMKLHVDNTCWQCSVDNTCWQSAVWITRADRVQCG